MKKLLLLLLFVPLVSFGQNDGAELCYKLGNRSFNTNTEALKSLQKILSVANLKTNRFVILPCDNISNAMASFYQGFRYILYKESWMNQSDNWGKMAVLAHEVGHHINGHTLVGYSLSESRQSELEADDWAGYAMAKLGASLAQTLEITKRFQTEDDTNSTHPNRAKRIRAFTTGWNTGNETISSKIKEKYVPDNYNLSASEFWNRANDKAKAGDYYGAITDYSMAIKLAPNNSVAYNNRGISKKNLKDYKGAIADFTKVIELDPDDADAYINRGISKSSIDSRILVYTWPGRKKNRGAIADFTKAIELDPDDAVAYNSRGISKKNLKDYKGAIADYTKAIELDPDDAIAYNNRGNSKDYLEDYYGAIADYSKAIELDPDYANAYYNRGIVFYFLKDLKAACADIRKAESLGLSILDFLKDDCN